MIKVFIKHDLTLTPHEEQFCKAIYFLAQTEKTFQIGTFTSTDFSFLISVDNRYIFRKYGGNFKVYKTKIRTQILAQYNQNKTNIRGVCPNLNFTTMLCTDHAYGIALPCRDGMWILLRRDLRKVEVNEFLLMFYTATIIDYLNKRDYENETEFIKLFQEKLTKIDFELGLNHLKNNPQIIEAASYIYNVAEHFEDSPLKVFENNREMLDQFELSYIRYIPYKFPIPEIDYKELCNFQKND